MKDLKWTVKELDFGFWGLYRAPHDLISRDFHDEGSANVVKDAHNESIDQLIKDRDYFQKLHDMEFKARTTLEARYQDMRLAAIRWQEKFLAEQKEANELGELLDLAYSDERADRNVMIRVRRKLDNRGKN